MALNETAALLNIDKGSYLGDDHMVKDFLGEGGFGFVVKCYNLENDMIEAIKVNKPLPEILQQAKKEIAILEHLQCLNPDTCYIVQYNGHFCHLDAICINFELLDQSLARYMEERDFQPLSMPELRPVMNQMTTALCHLRSKGIVHADLKPENIMVVNRHQQPLRVKLIDFGLAHPRYAMRPGACVQTTSYRAPEVMLQLHFNEAIDIWSLGVTAAELATGEVLYPGNMDYDVLSFIKETQGEPSDEVLDRGLGTDYYFNQESDGQRRWRLKTPEEFNNDTGFCATETRSMFLRSLDELKEWMIVDPEHLDHQLQLVDLIKKMLELAPEKRIKALEVLQHGFFTHRLPQTCDEDPWMENDEDPWTETDNGPCTETDIAPWMKKEADPSMESDNSPSTETDSAPWLRTEADPSMESDDDAWLEIESDSRLEPENAHWMESESAPWMDTEENTSTVSRQSFSLHTAGPENNDCCVEIDSAYLAAEELSIQDVQPEHRTKEDGCFKRFIRGVSNIWRYFLPCCQHELSPPCIV